jgi:ABC-type bacteriocin/lantibiotic exporter with double-glycine peptidase domain
MTATATDPPAVDTQPVLGGRRFNVPLITQMEEVECGAASLAMILAHYGCWVPLEELRVACGVSRDGASALSVVQAGRHYGLESSGGRLSIDDLPTCHGPVILFWRQSHFVVLTGIQGDVYTINDPAGSQRRLSKVEFERDYSNVALTFAPTSTFERRARPRHGVAGTLSQIVSRNRGAVVLAAVVGLLLTVPGVMASVLSALFVGSVLDGGGDLAVAPILIGGYLGVTILQFILSFIQQSIILRLQVLLTIRESRRMLLHMLRLPLATVFANLAGMLVYAVVMVMYSPVLAVVGLLMGAVNIVALWWVSKRQSTLNVTLQSVQMRKSAEAFNGLSMIGTMKATGSESVFFGRWAGAQVNATNAEQSVGRLTSALGALPSFLNVLTTVLVFAVGSSLIFRNYLDVPSLVAFQGLLVAFLAPLAQLVSAADQFQSARGQIAQIDDVLEYPVDPRVRITEDSEHIDRARLQGHITFDNVTFGYNPSRPPIISNFSLEIEPGQRVAIVGGSGSGKSTLGNLLVGLIHPWEGSVLIDGREHDDWPRELIAASLAKVDQSITLFRASIWDNITVFDDRRSYRSVAAAAADAQILPDIQKRDGGFAADVLEGGVNFSGGQAQRLEIARALALDPSIIVLDEATSALDTLSEQRLDSALRARGLTSIIIAHRLSTIRDSDLILVLDHGETVGRGTHDELMESCSQYRDLVGAA